MALNGFADELFTKPAEAPRESHLIVRPDVHQFQPALKKEPVAQAPRATAMGMKMETDEDFLKRVRSLFGKRLSVADARRLQRLQSTPRPRTSTILKPGAPKPAGKLRSVFRRR